MTRTEWLEEAEKYDQMATEAYARGDDSAGQLWEQKAQSSRFAADCAYDDTQDD